MELSGPRAGLRAANSGQTSPPQELSGLARLAVKMGTEGTSRCCTCFPHCSCDVWGLLGPQGLSPRLQGNLSLISSSAAGESRLDLGMNFLSQGRPAPRQSLRNLLLSSSKQKKICFAAGSLLHEIPSNCSADEWDTISGVAGVCLQQVLGTFLDQRPPCCGSLWVWAQGHFESQGPPPPPIQP